ncbi:hypothetical protein Z968_02155 [Clostridium novyi A str. 4552]|uniref:SCP domain-containing protein n=1 Tax=Clostridium novyi A str. 4552 TaxID=1444289 RepID=A0A0A0IDY9_CLONO|nr:CAP domain-containing protein [Clostridium novyi]KGM97825.1 hypothetical protein Z968_02155 [Clostridium novyi A str. 4552]
MKKKVLAAIIMASMMTIPSVVQAAERINVNRLYRQDICKTYTCVGEEFYKFLCKNLNLQNRTCSLEVTNTYDIVKLLNKPFTFNNTNTCVSNCQEYPYTDVDMKKNIFEYNDIKENTEIEVKNQDKPEVNNKEVNKETTPNNTVVSNSNLNKEENKNESVKPEVNKETTSNKKEEGKLTVAYKKAVNERMVQLVNELRASTGATPLKSIDVLNNLAEKRSEYMATTGEFSHNDKNGNFIFKDDLNRANYRWNSVGENIAQNYYSEDPNKLAEALFDQWKNSPGHYANMIKQDFNQIGFGIGISNDGKVYATQGFVGVR